MISYIRGDATKPANRPAAICHIVNNTGAWGAGFSGQLSQQYPEAYTSYRNSGVLRLGTVIPCRLDQITIYHMVAQAGLPSKSNPKPLDVAALERCLFTLDAVVPWEIPLTMPKIASGYGGYNWRAVASLIEGVIPTRPVHVYISE